MLYTPHYLLQLLQHCCKHTHHLNRIQTLLITTGLLFDHHQRPNSNSNPNIRSTFFYNTLIRAHLHIGNPLQAILLFTQMLTYQAPPNNHTFPSLIKAASLSSTSTARSIHAQVVRRGLSTDQFIKSCFVKLYAQLEELPNACLAFDEIPQPDLVSCNSMLDALCKNGNADSALVLFTQMTKRDVVSWTSMINGFATNQRFREAIQLFENMMTNNEKPNEATLVSVLSACANSDEGGALHQGKQIHAYIIRNEIHLTAFIGTALIDMYGKSGCLRCIRKLFNGMPEREVCTWNAMISALASNGRETEALETFDKMRAEGLRPNELTYVGVLTACARAGLVELGLRWFESMKQDFAIVPRMEHYGCVVDLLGRAGLLREASEFIMRMPVKAEGSVLGALLGACKVHGDVELGDEVGRRLLMLQPRHSGRYVVLSNMYAGVGRWEDAAELREVMLKAGIKKIAGISKVQMI
ncbi:tetratricopeptide repeat (TPR)-like superfamily protein [Tasmannia lanceolata]|uniref:tetratricopeptide repeat (TPR)-like superfamily protein n=1 Tax=Tasmannia lanceolata TaxID=3420 RepID=UPI004062F3F3